MIRYSMEIPTSKLGAWTPWCDLDFVLAHKVLEDAAYAEFFRRRPGYRELILDNSMHELGHPLPIEDLAEAIRRCRADYIIAPDKLGEPEWNAEQFNIAWVKLSGLCRVGAVMCGRTLRERNEYLAKVGHASMLLLPYRENRLLWYLENTTNIHFMFPRVHLLGVNTLDELKMFAAASQDTRFTNTWSMDTAKAVKWGIQGRRLDDVANIRGNTLASKDLLNLTDITLEQEAVIYENVQLLRKRCNPEVG